MNDITYTQLEKLIRSKLIPPFPIHYSDITRNAIAKRTLYERLFTLPWQPWKKYKLVQYPALYITTTATVHISFQGRIEKVIRETDSKVRLPRPSPCISKPSPYTYWTRPKGWRRAIKAAMKRQRAARSTSYRKN